MPIENYINPANDTNSDAVGKTPVTINLRWRYKTTTLQLVGNQVVQSSSSVPDGGMNHPNSVTIYGSWQVGGTAEISKEVCHLSGSSKDWFLRSEVWYVIPTKQYNLWGTSDWYQINYSDVEIDWADFFSQLQALFPLGTNKAILAAAFEGVSDSFDLSLEGYVNIFDLNSGYNTGSFAGDDNPLFNDSMVAIGDIEQTPMPDADAVFPSYDDLSITPLVSTAPVTTNVLANGTCESSGFTLPMTVKVWMGDKGETYGTPDNSGITNRDDSNNSSEPSNASSNLSSSIGFQNQEKESNIGAFSGAGYNPVQVFDGNAILPFDSIYFTSGDYNNFVANGGGIVTESGIFPNGVSLYIDKIRLSIEGSTMSVIQVSDFDATPVLNVGERIFGYIVNEVGDYESSFSGFISSKKRSLSGRGELIAYECQDLRHYLSQYITPAYFTYIPPEQNTSQNSRTLETIVKDMLVRAGLSGATIDLPGTIAPAVEWSYESIHTVLEWAARFFGDHVYYIDKSGILNFKKFTSGSLIKSFRIPSRGESVSSVTKVLSFYPIEDYSRSRSKIMLIGGFPVREISGEGVYSFPTLEVDSIVNNITNYKPKDEFIIDPKNNTNTGIFVYYDTKYNMYSYYFMYFTGKTLVKELPSTPDKSAEFIRLNEIYTHAGRNGHLTPYDNVPGNVIPLIGNWEMPIEHINTVPGYSFIFFNKGVTPGAASVNYNQTGSNVIIFPVATTIKYRYAIREDEPLKVSYITGFAGGVEVIKEDSFKKVSSPNVPIDDTNLMLAYLDKLKNFYKPEFGGQLVIDGLDLDLELLGKLSITNTSLPTEESDNLVIHSIEYDVTNKKTTVELTNKTYYKMPFFDVEREIARARVANKINTSKLMNEQLKTGFRRV